MPPSDLLHEALTRATLQTIDPQQPPPLVQTRGRFGSPLPDSLSNLSLDPTGPAQVLADDDMIPVQTPAPSAPTSPAASATPSRNSSRSTSPSRFSALPPALTSGKLERPRSGAGKPRRDKTLEKSNSKTNSLKEANMKDPLNKLPHELSARVFSELGVDDLLVCGRVSKRWKSSSILSTSASQMPRPRLASLCA